MDHSDIGGSWGPLTVLYSAEIRDIGVMRIAEGPSLSCILLRSEPMGASDTGDVGSVEGT